MSSAIAEPVNCTDTATPSSAAAECNACSRRSRVCKASLSLGILVAAATAGGVEYAHFLGAHRGLWHSTTHDRNAHYLASLKVASAIRAADLRALLKELEHSRIWPPLHPFVAGVVLAVGGLDYRLAVLPSLAGWGAAAFLAFVLARRCAGWAAGIIAAGCVLASPAHHSYATDIMLESLGACLSLAALYYYVRLVQDRMPADATALGLVLTALFLQKYNYWLLVILTLAINELVTAPRTYASWVRGRLVAAKGPGFLRTQSRQPLNYVAAILVVATAGICVHGDRPFDVPGWVRGQPSGRWSVQLYPPEICLTLLYLVVFCRVAFWFYKSGRRLLRRADPRWRQLVLWHVCPVACYLALPKHFSSFVWYISPANGGHLFQSTWLDRLSYYGHYAAEHYHVCLAAAVLTVALAAPAFFTARTQRSGVSAVLCFVLLGALLTVSHPNRQGRFLHSWIAAAWVAAGVGAAGVGAMLGRRKPAFGVATTAALATAVLCLALPGVIPGQRSADAGPREDKPSMLQVADVMADDLRSANRAVVLSTFPFRFMTEWTVLQLHGTFEHLEPRWFGFADADTGLGNRDGFAQWLNTTDCDVLIYCDTLPNTHPTAWQPLPECVLHEELRDVLKRQKVFCVGKQWSFPALGCRVTVWRRSKCTNGATLAQPMGPASRVAISLSDCSAR